LKEGIEVKPFAVLFTRGLDAYLVRRSLMSDVILDVRDLQTDLFTRWGVVQAVDQASFTLEREETLGLVGESGAASA
jgi:ABC-type polysaccharide/polyol phosphate transport system ATPase subunit